MDLSEKVALVTGAAVGIGLQITRELLKNGIQGVAMLDVNASTAADTVAKLTEEFGKGRVAFFKADVTNLNEFEDAFKKTIVTFHKLDIVINNAGIGNDIAYELEINTNLTGVIRGTLLGLKYLAKDTGGKGGIILNTASIAAFEDQHFFPIYAATKAGILNMSLGFGHSMYYARTGVKLISLCPGRTTTGLLSNLVLINGSVEECLEEIDSIISQPAEAVGRAAVHAIKHGESGSVWVIKANELYQLNMPYWKTYGKHITTFEIKE